MQSLETNRNLTLFFLFPTLLLLLAACHLTILNMRKTFSSTCMNKQYVSVFRPTVMFLCSILCLWSCSLAYSVHSSRTSDDSPRQSGEAAHSLNSYGAYASSELYSSRSNLEYYSASLAVRQNGRNDQASKPKPDPNCPTQLCQYRFDDCIKCLPNQNVARCRSVAVLSYLISKESSPNAKNNLKGRRNALNNILKNSQLANNGTFCNGFLDLFFQSNSTLDIGDDASVNSIGLGVILEEEILERFNIAAVVTSDVIYETSTPLPTPTVSYSPAPPTRTTQLQSTTNDLYINEAWHTLSGALRLPVAARQVVRSDGSLRVANIREILNSLTNRQDWANTFSNDPSSFKIQVIDGKTYLVFVDFKKYENEFRV